MNRLCEAQESMKPNIRYAIITPVRDEEEYLRETIRSVVRQSILPVEWIIVDDGSRDNTGKIVDEAAKQYPWIKALHRADRGRRVPGTGVMETFYQGYESLESMDWEFIVKLDGDVGLPADYFERCFEKFAADPKLGMCGGLMYCFKEGGMQHESHPMFQVRGPIKLYSRACWDAIGGLIKAPGWDTIDEVQANRLGWRTRTFPELKVIHYRPTGAVQGVWHNGVKNGRADYMSGYHPVFMAVKCIKRMFQPPYAVNALANAYGYVTGYTKGIPRAADAALVRYIRSQQMRRLFFMESIWR
jgi:biofilm PGA synthesis N-glycosyltransferase PgaC